MFTPSVADSNLYATTQELLAAREWIKDAGGPVILTDREVIGAIRHNYAGGWEQFLADA